ncbi:MAG TPA: DUF4468 domain-containing protein [Hanamia sp.]|nr:DUF4468 domain-containing protein [Hanamia sp.]
MKYILILLLISSNAMAQDTLINLPIQDGKIFYEHVYQDSGKTKNDLFIKSKDVFLRLFPNTKGVIQDEDKENGIVTGKGYFKAPALIKCTIRIISKDNKYKVQIFDFYEDDIPLERGYSIAIKKNRNLKSWKYFNYNVLNVFNQVETEMNKKISTDF